MVKVDWKKVKKEIRGHYYICCRNECLNNLCGETWRQIRKTVENNIVENYEKQTNPDL